MLLHVTDMLFTYQMRRNSVYIPDFISQHSTYYFLFQLCLSAIFRSEDKKRRIFHSFS